MTQEEREDFFQQIKGKKIRWSSWKDLSKYFVAEKLGVYDMSGTNFYEHSAEESAIWGIARGFQEQLTGSRWVLCESESSTSTNKSCTCDLLKVIMIQGCQCGSV